jgi:transketolase
MFAAHHELHNLTVVLDRNQLGSEDFTKDTCKLEPLVDKWKSFGWMVCEINGHDIAECLHTLSTDFQGNNPGIIISKTIKGNGMPSLENTPKSHHTLPKGTQIDTTRKNLLS